jgi:sialate O-acetylesterase
MPLVLLLSAISPSHADVKLPAIFSDHMVVLSGAKVPVWGWADAGEKVTATLAGQTQSAVADADGKWTLAFDKLAFGGPHVMTVEGKNKLTIDDVLVGEVWLGSGQSNMAMTANRSINFDQEKSAADLPQLRMFSVARNPQPKPQTDCEGKWEICTPDTVGGFSATLFYFGRDVQKELKVPMGLINSSYGGTAVESWTSMSAQDKLPEYATISAAWEEKKKMPWDQAEADANYEKQRAAWVEAAKKAKAAGKPAPRAPQRAVEPGLDRNHPSNLFNGMIAPLVPYAIRGAVWYQGENNSAKPFANLYGLQLKTLITDWRSRWGYEFPFAWVQLPDYRAPQANPVEDKQTWPVIREQMLNTLSVPATGMAVTLGLGEETDIHPRNKQGVGKRLALWALHDVYGKSGPSSGPLPSNHRIEGKYVVVTFKHTDGGLKSHDGGELKGFAIAGADGKFVWAQARIDGDKVIVSSPEVPEPKAVRYAWADNPIWSLENGAGLPASPFRTDVEKK